MRSCLLAIIWLMLPAVPLPAQDGAPAPDLRNIDQERWEHVTKGLDYSDNSNKPTEKKAPKQKPPSSSPTGDETQGVLLAPIFQVMGFLVLAVLLGWVLYLLIRRMGGTPNLRARPVALELEDLDRHLPEADLEALLAKALLAGDHRLALRIQYLRLIQALHHRGHIAWRPDRTNTAYLRETAGQPWHPMFRQTTRWFELAWYANSPVTEAAYHRLAPHFEALLAAIGPARAQNQAA